MCLLFMSVSVIDKEWQFNMEANCCGYVHGSKRSEWNSFRNSFSQLLEGWWCRHRLKSQTIKGTVHPKKLFHWWPLCWQIVFYDHKAFGIILSWKVFFYKECLTFSVASINVNFHCSHFTRNMWVQAGNYSDNNQLRRFILHIEFILVLSSD